jgi:hypothetical protein
MPIAGDSTEYEILKNACTHVKGDNLLTCEIGVREGLGSQIILEAFKDKTHWHIGIDPYGNINYPHYDDNQAYRADYTNQMKLRLLQDLNYPNFTLFTLEDIEFFKRFADGIPIYQNEKKVLTHYDLVHFDGPHRTTDVIKEVIFFTSRAKDNCVFIFDDYPKYNMSLIWDMLNHYYNYEQIERGKNKIVFQKHA